MKDILANIFGFLYTLSMGDYIFLACTFIIILAFIYMLYLMKKDEELEPINKTDEISTLENIKETIEREYKPETIILTDYEKEQEENAIISYDELIKNKNKINISYDEEYESVSDEVVVKKINISENSIENNNKSNLEVKLMSYDKEEAFLTALKQLQQNLSN